MPTHGPGECLRLPRKDPWVRTAENAGPQLGLSCPSGPRGGGERDWEGTVREGAAQIIEEACVCEQECECVSACAEPQENKTKHIP